MMNLAAFWQQMLPTMPVLPVLPTRKYCSVNNLAFDPHHGMEEVIGSIPIRSTNHFTINQVAVSIPKRSLDLRIGTTRLCELALATLLSLKRSSDKSVDQPPDEMQMRCQHSLESLECNRG
jgi:hypothetical protein